MTNALAELRARASESLAIMTCLCARALSGHPAPIGTVAFGRMLQLVYCVSGKKGVSIFRPQSSTS